MSADGSGPALKDLPKVDSDLKTELQQVTVASLNHVEPVEKNVLPSKEGTYVCRERFVA
jgi:hypothetical protein